MAGHRPCEITVIIFCCLVFVTAVAINILAGLAGSVKISGFNSGTRELAYRYWLEITPIAWDLTGWGINYIYQFIWLVYALTTLCRGNHKGFLYYEPSYMPIGLYLVFILNMVLNVAWIILWDNQLLIGSLIVMALISLTLYICLFISFYGLMSNASKLIDKGFRREIYYVIAFVQNGLAYFATWTAFSTLLNLAHVLTYEVGLSQEIASSIALSVLVLDFVLHVLVDFVVFERYFRFVFTPYIVLILIMATSMIVNWDSDNSNSIFSAGIIMCASLVLIIKMSMSILIQHRRPLFTK